MRVCDLFAGLGGFSAGALAAGAEVILGVDNDPVPLKLWSANVHGGRAVLATLGPGGDGVEFLPPPESADVAPVCQFDVAAATAWDGDSMEGIYAAPLSVDADARKAADAADTTLLAERERDVWLNLTFGARRAWRAEWRVGAARYRVGVGSGCDGVLTAHS